MAALLAADSDGVPDVGVVPGAIALTIAVVAALAIVWLVTTTRPRRPRAAPPTMDLRPERPAVVDLLTGGFDVEDDAVPATVVDLAARGWYTIEDAGGGERIILRLRQRRPDGDVLTDYEQRVLQHIERHADDGVVPAPVLTLGPHGVSRRWVRGFTREVTADARAGGLCRRRWDPLHVTAVWVVAVLAVAPAAMFVAFADTTSDPDGWQSLGNLLVLMGFVVGALPFAAAARITGSEAQADTPAGLAAAAHWMGVRTFFRDHGRFGDKGAPSVAIWDRNLAYATALGLAPVVERQIPFETEHDKHAWSRATGEWRRVKVRYRSLRPGRGRHPALVAFLGLLQAAAFAAVAYGGYYVAGLGDELVDLSPGQQRSVGLAGLIVAAVGAVACVSAITKLLLGVSDLFARRTSEGELVRKRTFSAGFRMPRPLEWLTSSGDSDRRKWFLAVDDGASDRIQALSVRPSIYHSVQQGARIRVTSTPRLGYVREVESLAPPHGGPGADDEPVAIAGLGQRAGDPLAEALARLPGGATVIGGLAAALDQLQQGTNDDGTSLLDAVDAEGVALRDRLAADDARIERLRGDPGETSHDPLLGQILDTLAGDGRADLEPPDDPGQPDVDGER